MAADEKNRAGEIKQFLSFRLGSEFYAVPLLSVKEVIAMPEITPIPYTPAHFLGMMDLRGRVISVIDLRAKLGIKAQELASPAVIICDLKSLTIGVVVSDVTSVLPLRDFDVQPRPQIESKQNADYIAGVTHKDGRFVIILDIGKVLNVEDNLIFNQGVI